MMEKGTVTIYARRTFVGLDGVTKRVRVVLHQECGVTIHQARALWLDAEGMNLPHALHYEWKMD